MPSRPDPTCSLVIAPDQFPDPEVDAPLDPGAGERAAVLAGGCFWCVEAIYKRLEGVSEVTSGYAGDSEETADYRTVCSGSTNHAEVIEVRYDAGRTTFGQLLKIFFAVAHDPTQLDRQGNDVGRQYRSAIFYADADERRLAEAYIEQLERAGIFDAPIVTTLEPLEAFFPAEEYHQDYADRNPSQPYVAATATPKVEKLERYFGDRLNER